MHYSKIVEKRRLELEKQAAEATQALNKLTSDVVEAKFKKREELLLQVKAIETDLASMLDIPSEELLGPPPLRSRGCHLAPPVETLQNHRGDAASHFRKN